MTKKTIVHPAQVIAAYKDIFSSQSGKIVLHDLMKKGHMLKSTYAPTDPYSSAFQEGERNIVLKIMSNLEFTETQLSDMMSEAKQYTVGVTHD